MTMSSRQIWKFIWYILSNLWTIATFPREIYNHRTKYRLTRSSSPFFLSLSHVFFYFLFLFLFFSFSRNSDEATASMVVTALTNICVDQRYLGGLTYCLSCSFSVLCMLLFVVVLCLVCLMLPVSLDCPFQIAPSVFSDVYMPNYQSTLNPFRVCYFNLWCETDKLDILRVC